MLGVSIDGGPDPTGGGRRSDSAALDRQIHELRESIADRITRRRLTALKVGVGWRCLEVGAGTGSIARWLAARVGSTGHVVATETDLRFLDGVAARGIEVRRHDITCDDIESASFDLVHCRGVLMHVPSPELAMRRMVYALRPGGWLVVEEPDFGSVSAADFGHPAAQSFTDTTRRLIDTWRGAGWRDPYVGRRVRPLIEALGLTEVGHDGEIWVSRGGEPGARFMAYALQVMQQTTARLDLVLERTLAAALVDPTFSFVDVSLFSSWGRRAV